MRAKRRALRARPIACGPMASIPWKMSAFCPFFYSVRKLIAGRRKTDTLQVSAKRSFDGQTERAPKGRSDCWRFPRVIANAQDRIGGP